MRPFLLLPVLLGAWLLPAEVPATSCGGWSLWSDGDLLPGDGAEDVPTNTLIWALSFHDRFPCPEAFSSISLVDDQGVQIPLVQEGRICARQRGVVGWRPVEELEPGRTYTVVTELEQFYEQSPESTFRVGDGPDLERPSVPAIRFRRLATEPNQFQADCVSRQRDEATWRIEPSAELHLLAGGHGSLDLDDEPEELWSDLAAVSTDDTLTLRATMQPATKIEARVGAVDLAGNHSGWSEPDTGTMPAAGCGSERAYDAALLLLLPVAGAGRLRRRS